MGITFDYRGTTPSTATGYDPDHPHDNENLVIWQEDHWPFDPNAIGVTLSVFYTDTGEMVDADIVLNGVNYRWATDGDSGGGHDIENTLAHELGHFMGLAHNPEVPGATMFPATGPGETAKRSLHDADIATLITLYGDGTRAAPAGDAVGNGASGRAVHEQTGTPDGDPGGADAPQGSGGVPAAPGDPSAGDDMMVGAVPGCGGASVTGSGAPPPARAGWRR